MNALGKQPLSPRAQRPGLICASVLALLAVLPSLWARPVAAAPTLRYSTDLRGDLVLFGNTGGFDCRAMPAAPDPVLGTIDRSACGRSIEDSSPDLFWRSDLPSDGRALADAATLPADARTTSLLQVPSGAKIAYARIYWSSSLNEGYMPSPAIVIDRPGVAGFKEITVTADPKDIVRDAGGSSLVFQASADISRIVQTYGAGAYRVRGYATSPLVDLGQDVAWVSWSVLAAYRDDTAPVRNITIFDGLTRVGPDAEVPQPISGFAVPPTGTPDGRLTLIAYEGDSEKTGDSLIWNGTLLADAQNPADNFFNSTRSRLGQAVSVAGDLPQLSGAPNSMASVDMDVVDISGLLTPGATSANVALRVTSDVVYLGVLATAIVSKKPILETTLTYPPGSSMRPGDVLEFTSSTRNIGDDTAQGTVITHKLPAGLSYVPGSVRVTAGPNAGQKTDAAGDDQVEYEAASRSLILRLGSGASASQGGSISPQDAASVVKYQLRIDDTAAPGDLPTQSSATATPSATPTATPVSYPSGNGVNPGAPTVIVVPPCGSNADCAAGAPVCDRTQLPPRCGNFCSADTDCAGASGGNTVCDLDTRTCVECTAMQSGACGARDGGALCLVGSGRCGCASNADCGGRTCDLLTGRCPKPEADLSVQVATSPDPATVDMPVRYSLRVNNKGPATAPPGAQLVYTVPDGGTLESVTPGAGFRCTLSERTVTCRYLNKIVPAGASSTVDIVVKPRPLSPNGTEDGGTPILASQVTVGSDSSSDPNPGDNTAEIRTELGLYRSAGGGLGCTLTHERTQASRYSAVAMLLALGLLARSLRRRRAAALPSQTETA
jgi:uncharacterized repeat protein (TIGR01451 family)